MAPTATEIGGKLAPDVPFARMRIAPKQGGRRHDHTVRAVAALRRRFGDEGRLHRMRTLRTAEALEGRDLLPFDGGGGGNARADRLAVDNHRASAALTQAAAKPGPAQMEIVAQHIEKRGVGVAEIDRVAVTVHTNGQSAHRTSTPCWREDVIGESAAMAWNAGPG